jgi:hypothetical protein
MSYQFIPSIKASMTVRRVPNSLGDNMSYQKQVWSGGVGAVAASEPTRYGRVTVRGSLGAIAFGTGVASGGGVGGGSAAVVSALSLAARAAVAEAMRLAAIYGVADRAFKAVWIPGKNDNAPTVRTLRSKASFALLAWRAASAKAAAASAAVDAARRAPVAQRVMGTGTRGAVLERFAATSKVRAGAAAEAAAAKAQTEASSPPGGSTSYGSGSGGSSGGGGGGGGGSSSYGGGGGGSDPTPELESPTGPPVEMPAEPAATEKKPMSTAAKVGLAAAAGFALFSMFAAK